MFKNIFKAIFFVGVTICCFSNNYVSGEVENSKINSVESQQVSNENFSVMEAYYKEQPWDFVESRLKIEPRQFGPLVLLEDCFIFLFSFGTVMGVITAIEQGKEPSPLSIVSGLVTGIVFTILFHKYVTSTDMKYENLISILDSYDPDLKKLGPNNTKQYIPQELHLTFDTLWKIYKQQGEKALKSEWDRVAGFIHDKIVFDLKSAKYVPPVTNTYVTVIR